VNCLGSGPGKRSASRRTRTARRIVKGGPAPQVTKEEFKHRLDRARELYKPLPEFAGMSGLEYQRWIRPDRIDI
jgi:hypothetical protein